MDPKWLTAQVISVFVCAIILAHRRGSLFLGLSWLCFYQVVAATMSAFSHARLFNAPLDWFSFWHAEVVRYSVLGSLAMLLGMALAWRAWRKPVVIETPQWATRELGILLFGVGIVATGFNAVLWSIPTIGPALDLLTRFRELGLVIFVLDAVIRRSWNFVAGCALIYIPIAFAGALATGHTPAKVDLLLPIACIVAGWRRVTFRSAIILAASAIVFYLMFAGWMGSRAKIREGEFVERSFAGAAAELAGDMVEHASAASFAPESVNERLRDRIDMSDILAFQRLYQPQFEPFAYGQTFLDASIALVPRVFWPGKPTVAGGSAFVSKYTGLQRPIEDETSIGLPFPSSSTRTGE